MSNGRVILGVGAGDDELECRQLGISMPSARERVRLLGEMIQSVREMWGETNPLQTAGSGHHLQPAPVQSPRVPILIAGVGRSTLRHVAEHADAVSFPPTLSAGDAIRGVTLEPLSPADVEQKLAILKTHCTDLSRPFSSLVRSHMAPVVVAETPTRLADKLNGLPERMRTLGQLAITGTPEQVTQAYESLMLGGIDYFIAAVLGNDTETLELLAHQVWPALEDSAARRLPS
jgi:alkanesulfonate monooxygenase SsuD/methylene tetrahydromethanopterin reductase-like flavin-dependent oxidoreductase (luciferase family)